MQERVFVTNFMTRARDVTSSHSSEYQSTYENCSTFMKFKGPIFLFYYDERKERLLYLLLHMHVLFFESFCDTLSLEAIFL